MVYGNWTRGVRSGGYNVRNTSTSIPPGPYDPEVQDAFEVGWKSTWFNRRLRFNSALFYDTVKKLQRDVNQTDRVVGIVQVTRNTADATIQGFEIELAGALTDELVLYAKPVIPTEDTIRFSSIWTAEVSARPIFTLPFRDCRDGVMR
jgi:iron complex outermembrane receptor protein